MFNFKAVLLIVILGVVLMHETEAHPKLKLKLKLLKAKLIAPHIAAKVAVAKEVKAKTAIAAVKTVAAIKAKKAAALSIITAPIKVLKKKLLIKAKKVKAVKAAKIATLAGAAAVLSNLKKQPIILPSPVFGKSIDINAQLPILGHAGIHKSFYFNKGIAPAAVAAPVPVYRFVPDVEFTNYNTVAYQPQVQVEVPHHIPEIHSSSKSELIPALPHQEYGPPAAEYGVPRF